MVTDTVRHDLIEAARQVRNNAYAPYSKYFVGAALLADTGEIFTGCNVENAAYPSTICAERTALVKAVSESVRRFTAIAVVTENGGFPCGSCRQMLYEFSPSMLVIVANQRGEVKREMPLLDLLPEGFGPEFVNPTGNQNNAAS
jgi:cytidine deaminase